jgi:16S rRNA (guanine966-N2)-methyltransferase
MRIVGGTYRSRAIKAPNGHATRPTSDRVREALFSILQGFDGWQGGRVLDLFAGTGALGLEALSRGASEAFFVERDRDALQALRSNIRDLDLGSTSHVLAVPVERAARMLQGNFDLVFVDPPYAEVAAAALQLGTWLPERINFTLVFEHSSADQPPVVGTLTCIDTRKYGDTALSFFTPSPAAVVAS